MKGPLKAAIGPDSVAPELVDDEGGNDGPLIDSIGQKQTFGSRPPWSTLPP